MLSVIKVILIVAAVILTTANLMQLIPVASVTSTATEYVFLTV